MSRLPLRTLGSLFLRIGNTTFGGGDPTIAALQRELVEHRRVMSPEEYAVLYALSRVTPGTNMLAFCAGSGWIVHRWWGAIVALSAVTVPSSLVGILLLNVYEKLLADPAAAVAIAALLAAAVGLMFAGAWLLARPYVTPSAWLRTAAIGFFSFLLVWTNLLSPIATLTLAAITGYFWREPNEA